MGFYPSEGDVDSNGAEEVNLRTAAGAELLGQQVSAASLPVVISSDQSTLPISAASLPLPTGAATAALQTTGNTSLAAIDAGIPAALGQTTMTASMPIVIASDQSTINVSVVPPAGADVFSAVGERTGVGATEVPVMILKNPSGSGKVISINQILLVNRHTVSSNVVFRCYTSPTITANGTAITIPTLDVGSGKTTVAQAFRSPTISANGTLAFTTVASGGANANPTAMQFAGVFTLQANTDILITAIADGINRIPVVTMIWEEA